MHAYATFHMLKETVTEETSCMSSIRLHAMIMCIVDSFKKTQFDLYPGVQELTPTTQRQMPVADVQVQFVSESREEEDAWLWTAFEGFGL